MRCRTGGPASCFVQQKQWNKVREARENPGDALIEEGYPVHEPRFTRTTVYAALVTTEALQAAKRQSQDGTAG